jgi:transcriptional regulator with XRE-family HTH domain
MKKGNNIRKLREQAGLNQRQLSELSGVEVGTISALEIRGSSRSEFFGPIAFALGTTIEDLVSDSGANIATKKLAAEQIGGYSQNIKGRWPFRTVAAEEWIVLSLDSKNLAESYIRGLIDAQKIKPAKMA